MAEPPQGTNVPATVLTDVDLDALESMIYRRQYEEAVRALHVALNRLKRGREFAGYPSDDRSRRVLYSRLAAAIGTLLCDPTFTLSEEGFDRLCVEHATLRAIFRASAFGNADHLLCQFGMRDPDDPGKLTFTTPEGVGRLLMLYSLDSSFELDFEQAIRFDPRRALPVFLGMLAAHVVLSGTHHARRERLLGLGHLFEQAGIEDHMLLAMADAYMYCSYAGSGTKHAIKGYFNAMSRRLIQSRVALPAFPGRRELKARPTMLVPVDAFGSRHAMYRCNAPAIRQLRDRFKLVLMGGETDMDDVSKQLFDEVVVLPSKQLGYQELLGKIGSVAPDIIFYPSLGMSPYWMALSSVRLAPIQVMALGHPATSLSESIDYVLTSEALPGDVSTLYETTFLVSGNQTMVRRDDADFPAPVIRDAPEVLRIAVPSMVAKLNPAFLEVCRNLARLSPRRLEFHFFPSVAGLWHYVTALEIRHWLPEAVVYQSDDYNRYLRNLGRCDVHLSTFPFGGTNTNMDTMKLCIPMVTLEGLEVHSQMDSAMMRAVGLPEWLITHDSAEFESAALRLIANDQERVSLARMLNRLDIEEIFSDRPGNRYSADFADAAWFVYLNHERIRQSGKRYWTVAERRGFRSEVASVEDVSREP